MMTVKYPCFIHFVLFSVMIILLDSCTPQSCQEETETLAGASFYKTGLGKMTAPDTVTVYGSGKEARPIYDKAVKKAVIFLPLNPSGEKCSFIIKINNLSDTLSLFYSTFPHLVSKECGYIFHHDITGYKYTTNIIDTVIVTNKRITARDVENLRIFF